MIYGEEGLENKNVLCHNYNVNETIPKIMRMIELHVFFKSSLLALNNPSERDTLGTNVHVKIWTLNQRVQVNFLKFQN